MQFQTTLNLLSILIHQMLTSTVTAGRITSEEALLRDEDFDQWWHEQMNKGVCGPTYVKLDFLLQVAKKAREELCLEEDEVRMVLTSWLAHILEERPDGEVIWLDTEGATSIEKCGGCLYLTEEILLS